MRRGACVSWSFGHENAPFSSTTEAEYVSLSDVIKELPFMKQVLCFVSPDVGIPHIPVFGDNQGAGQLVWNPDTNFNSKHNVFRHHFLR